MRSLLANANSILPKPMVTDRAPALYATSNIITMKACYPSSNVGFHRYLVFWVEHAKFCIITRPCRLLLRNPLKKLVIERHVHHRSVFYRLIPQWLNQEYFCKLKKRRSCLGHFNFNASPLLPMHLKCFWNIFRYWNINNIHEKIDSDWLRSKRAVQV